LKPVTYIAFIYNIVLQEGVEQVLGGADHFWFVNVLVDQGAEAKGSSYWLILSAIPNVADRREEYRYCIYVSSSLGTELLRWSQNHL
jgi:hypothetical protein